MPQKEFLKYQHVEKFDTDETEGILDGECYVFPKIDGTNGSVWISEGEIKAGSRKRELSLEDDNANFYATILEQNNIKFYLEKYPHHRLYGEFLAPHSLKTYRANAWRRFYVFDVYEEKEDGTELPLHYREYEPLLEKYDIDYIPPIARIEFPTEERLYSLLKENTFLIQDEKGAGEGIVIKNYDFINKFGRIAWAKIVTNEFKSKHFKALKDPVLKESIERKIVDRFCTPSFIEKEYQKIVTEKDGWSSKYIPMLLGRVYHEFIVEEMWEILKKFKNPTIDFRELNKFVSLKVKEVKGELF